MESTNAAAATRMGMMAEKRMFVIEGAGQYLFQKVKEKGVLD